MRKSNQDRQKIDIDPSWRIGIVHSSFYKEEMESMVTSAREALLAAGIPESQILTFEAAGSWEVPLLGRALAESRKVDGLIGLGVIVEGETRHAALLAAEAARAIMDVQIHYELPFAFEILHVPSIELARARAMGKGNKGEEAAHAVLHSLSELKRIRSEEN
jgi:6,7-dimethyl-8-ribityllumazine synthase